MRSANSFIGFDVVQSSESIVGKLLSSSMPVRHSETQ
jgi:hypothetical protein